MSTSVDFILMPGKTVVLILKPYGPPFSRAIERMQEAGKFQLVESLQFEMLPPLVKQVGPCIVVSHCQTQEALRAAVPFIQAHSSDLKVGKIKWILTTPVKDSPWIELLRAAGISELINQPINDKILFLKIEKFSKTLPSNDALTLAGKSTEQTKQVRFVAPLKIKSDIWLIKNEAQRFTPKIIIDKWVMKLEGFTPQAGEWKLLGPADDDELEWEWIPIHPVVKAALLENGSWRFKGSKCPDYVENVWWFTGKKLRLAFFEHGKNPVYKAVVDSDGTLVVAEDSIMAFKNAPKLQASRDGRLDLLIELPLQPKIENIKPVLEKHFEVRIISPLALESDFWIFEKGTTKRVNGMWSVRLKGPSLEFGKWIEERNGVWKWECRYPEHDPFVKEMGSWYFKGEMPRFSEGLWYFSGKLMELYFEYNGENFGSRIVCKEEHVLEISSNSDASLAAEGLYGKSKELIKEIKKAVLAEAELKEIEARNELLNAEQAPLQEEDNELLELITNEAAAVDLASTPPEVNHEVNYEDLPILSEDTLLNEKPSLSKEGSIFEQVFREKLAQKGTNALDTIAIQLLDSQWIKNRTNVSEYFPNRDTQEYRVNIQRLQCVKEDEFLLELKEWKQLTGDKKYIKGSDWKFMFSLFCLQAAQFLGAEKVEIWKHEHHYWSFLANGEITPILEQITHKILKGDARTEELLTKYKNDVNEITDEEIGKLKVIYRISPKRLIGAIVVSCNLSEAEEFKKKLQIFEANILSEWMSVVWKYSEYFSEWDDVSEYSEAV